MARLQILELPAGSGDDRPPFVLVVDQYNPLRYVQGIGEEPAVIDEFEGVAEKIGARQVLVFAETVDIPANETPPVPEDPEHAGTTQIVYAHERTRLDLCSALLLDSGTTWRKLIETVSERQRELVGLYRKYDEANAKLPVADDAKLMDIVRRVLDITPGDGPPDLAAWLYTACRELEKSEAARQHLRNERKDARMWARHGYEIGQRHCGWTDHGVAPDWLTEGWPRSFDSCEHLKQAAEFDEALTRVRGLSTEPEVMSSDQPHPDVWRHGYRCGVLAARSATRPRNEPTVKP